jgi:hypothetical protein
VNRNNGMSKFNAFVLISVLFFAGCKIADPKKENTLELSNHWSKNQLESNADSKFFRSKEVDIAREFVKKFLRGYKPISKKYGGRGEHEVVDTSKPASVAAVAALMAAENWIYEGSLKYQLLGCAAIIKIAELGNTDTGLNITAEEVGAVAKMIDPTIPGVRL